MTITFRCIEETTAFRHPTSAGGRCRPDAIASAHCDEKNWTGFDAAVGIHSGPGTNDDEEEELGTAVSYAYYLLQARPDRVSIPGFHATDDGIQLILASAGGATISPVLHMSTHDDIALLLAFMCRLYDPWPTMLDPTVTRRKDTLGDGWLFDIALRHANGEHLLCPGYSIAHARMSFGYRGHVFTNTTAPASLDGSPVPVIKEWYSKPGRDRERMVLRYIHSKDREKKGGAAENEYIPDVPGVVHLVHEEEVKWEDGRSISSGGRVKMRLALREHGRPLMDLRTPFEVLIAIYDLLETTRLLYSHGVLHRDISAGNVMLISGKAVSASTSNSVEETPPSSIGILKIPARFKFYSARYLLNLTNDPNDTCNLLVDFGISEILHSEDNTMCTEICGTPRFMARAIRKRSALGRQNDVFLFNTIQMQSLAAFSVYEMCHAERLDTFGRTETEVICRITSSPEDIQHARQKQDESSARHDLRHDAESIFWLLAWWSLNASPANADPAPMHPMVYATFADDQRDLRPIRFVEEDFETVYAPMMELLNDLGLAVQNDLFWADEVPYSCPDFLHECMQRLILDFLFENKDRDYMCYPTSGSQRLPGRE